MSRHHDFPQFAGKQFERSDRTIGVQAVDLLFDKPSLVFGDGRFASPPPLGHFASVDGPIAHDTIQPGHGIGGRLALPDQLDEGLLHDVLRFSAPLPRTKHESRSVQVDELCNLCWCHQ